MASASIGISANHGGKRNGKQLSEHGGSGSINRGGAGGISAQHQRRNVGAVSSGSVSIINGESISGENEASAAAISSA